MAIIHIVMFKFNPSIDHAIIQDACNRMVDLRNQCIHPTSKKPYITTASGGRQDSPEANKADYSHVFVMEFASEEDRKFYVDEDPAHVEFKKSMKGLVERVGVMDYNPGVY